jgi:hypothetical protein
MDFWTTICDMLSGYKALSRRFVKSSRGFETETELATRQVIG